MPRNERLRQHRLQRYWRQQDVADHLQTSLVTVQRWERGTHQPGVYHRARLCALFGLSAWELGLGEEEPLSPAPNQPAAEEPASPAPDAAVALWTVPYRRNPHFTGREDLLAQLDQRFAPSDASLPGDIRRVALNQAQAITGLGGIGKTQIAVEYAYRAYEQGRYGHTLWITASSEEAILTALAALAEIIPTRIPAGETDQRKLARTVIEWLELCEQPWLLIFDNADDLSLLIPYLPQRGPGNVLLTTRASAVGALASSLEVDNMSLMEGTQLLLRRAQREASSSISEINEATTIAMALAQFPLALDQAGAYIEETGCSLHDYFQLYQQHRYALLARRGKQATDYPESVATTWSLSFVQLEATNPSAAELLRLCALLAPDHIPEELLTEGAPYWPPMLQQAAKDPFAFNQVVGALLAFSLVKRQPENHLLSLHRLVQVVQVERIPPEEQRQWAERIVRAMNALFPRNPKDEVTVWPQCQRYLEQVQVCDALIEQHHLLLSEASSLLERAATYLCERALYSLAEPLYQRALSILEQQGRETHLQIAVVLNGLAHLYYEQGKFAQAEPLRQRALRTLEQQEEIPPDQVVIALNGLASVYFEQGKYAQAEPLYQRALRIWEQQVGLEHPQKAFLLHGLATLYYEQGRYSQAEPLYQQALHIRERALGDEHLRVAYSLNALALVYSQQGKFAQAESLYQRALCIREQRLGPEHFKVAIVLDGLAALYSRQGKDEQAEQLYQRALRIWEQQMRSEHPLAALALHGLAALYSRQGKRAQAGLLYERALSIMERYLGPEHRKMASVLHDFADLQQSQGSLLEAASLYQRALLIQGHALGPGHPLTSETRNRLHAVLLDLGRAEEAAALETRVLVSKEGKMKC